MQSDFLKDLGPQGLTARLKRLSDLLFYDIKELYDYQGLDLEPSWHLVFLLLQEQGSLSMSEIASATQISQPAIFKMITKMKSRGYVSVRSDKADMRKKRVQLTAKAKKTMPEFEKVWKAGRAAIEEMLLGNNYFLTALELFETAASSQSFKERTLKQLQK